MTTPRPFPTVSGRCICNKIRYQLLTSPLFCYACHCPDCQKQSGSAFVSYAIIERTKITITSATSPILVSQVLKPGLVDRHVECGQCRTYLWGYQGFWGDAVAGVRVGTLDYPSLMMPDVHSFVESKLAWLKLPEGARTAERSFEYRDVWPKDSLKRLDECLEKFGKEQRDAEGVVGGEVEREVGEKPDAGEASGEGEKTPTGADVDENEGEDDEAFERRFKETERALQERLERLSLKLDADQQKNEVNGTTA